MFIIAGSISIPAISPGFSASTRATASRSPNGTITVSAVSASGIAGPVGTVFGRDSGPASSSVGYTENCTWSWWPWYEPSTLMIFWRPVAARMRWTAFIVASVPELPNRQRGSPNRRWSSSATTIVSGTGCAKCVPSATRSETVRTMTGCACPTSITPKPACRSTYSVPSASKTCDPCRA